MILPHHGVWPKIHETAFVAPSSDVIGEVELGAHSSVWFQVVIRGDVQSIHVGERTNIQDHVLLHVSRSGGTQKGSRLTIGNEVTVGHRATLHGCVIGNRVLIGMGAIVMDDAEIGDDCIVAAGALVPKGMKVPSGVLVLGFPAEIKRPLSEQERAFLRESAANYVGDATEYRGYVRGPRKMGDTQEDLELAPDDFTGDLDNDYGQGEET